MMRLVYPIPLWPAVRQPISINRALYGSSPGWFLPLIFGTVLGLGILRRLTNRRAFKAG